MVRILQTVFLLLFALGCNSVGTFKEESSGEAASNLNSFGGVKSFDVTSTGKLVLNWTPPATSSPASIQYEIYMDTRTEDVEAVTTGALAIDTLSLRSMLSSLSLADAEEGTFWEFETANQPSSTSAPLTQIEGARFYQIDEQIFADRTYLFQVRAKDADGNRDSNNKVLVYRKQSAEEVIGDYNGCSSANGQTPKTVLVSFDFPEDADKISIFRDGEQIYSTKNHSKTSYVDWGLDTGKEYEYICKITVNGDELEGSESVFSTPQTPLEAIGTAFDGCVSGLPLSTNSIRINYDFRPTADSVKVFRNGIEAFASNDPSSSYFIDTSLAEGVEYNYTCGAVVDGQLVMGSLKLPVTTFATSSPVFSGITSVSPSASSATVSWGPTSGVPVSYFKVWAVVTAVDYTATPTMTLAAGNQSTVIPNLGDELTYNFAVRACNVSDQCDGNVVVETLPMPDTGAPTTQGITAAELVSGEVILTVPWSAANGAVNYRKIYWKEGGSGATDASLTGYSEKAPNVTIASPYTNVNQTVTINSDILGGKTYHFIVRDVDPSLQANTNTNFFTVVTTDITKPAFPFGIESLVIDPANKEGGLIASWTAIKNETEDSVAGASDYVIFTKEGGGDACSDGAEYNTYPASVKNTVYTETISGLSPRTTYAVCVKAKDSADNYNSEIVNLTSNTIDTTPPVFTGVQSFVFDNADSEFDMTWNPSNSADIDSYVVEVWKYASANTADPGSTSPFTVSHDAYQAASVFHFDFDDFEFLETEFVYVIVNACDNGLDVSGGQKNCTNIAYSASQNEEIPDITPPPSFGGITTATSPVQGTITANWSTRDWSDYAGFLLYYADPSDDSITLKKNCPCVDLDCVTNPILSCTISNGILANKNYRLYVRAYDSADNSTLYLNPDSKYAEIVAKDSTAPAFTPALNGSVTGTDITLTWNAATDNQVTGDITYDIYRKTGTDYSTPLTPILSESDGSTILATVTHPTLTYSDDGLPDSTDYYYVICASDDYSTPNTTCSSSKKVTIGDGTPPVISALTSTFTNAQRTTFDVSWTIDDTPGSTLANIAVDIYLKETDSATDWPLENGSYRVDGLSGLGVQSIVKTSAEYKFYNYVIKATDENLNTSTVSVSVLANAPNLVQTNLLASYDASFWASDTYPLSASSWLDLSGNSNNGALTGGTSWDGDGTSSDVFRIGLDGVNGKIGFGSVVSAQASYAIGMWYKADSAATADAILMTNGGDAGNGFALRQTGGTDKLTLQIDNSVTTLPTPIAHFKLDEAYGASTFVDSVGSADTTVPASTFELGVAGKFNSGLGVNKTTNTTLFRPNITAIDTSAGAYTTISMWVKSDFSSGTQYLFSMNGHSARVLTTGEVQFYDHTDARVKYAGFIDTSKVEWIHVVMQTKSDITENAAPDIKLWINGIEKNPTSVEGTWNRATSELISFGSYWLAAATLPLYGNMDDIQVFDGVLTDAQVKALYWSGCELTGGVTNGQWSRLDLDVSATSIDFYHNGQKRCELEHASADINGTTNLFVGSTSTSSDGWDGSVAQAQIYSSISSTDINSNFSNTANAFRTVPLSCLVTDNLIAQLDPANAILGLAANADAYL